MYGVFTDGCGRRGLYLGFSHGYEGPDDDAPDAVDVVPNPGNGCAVRNRTYWKNDWVGITFHFAM
jgi:hypothetical protein